jgi:hypothetical protein
MIATACRAAFHRPLRRRSIGMRHLFARGHGKTWRESAIWDLQGVALLRSIAGNVLGIIWPRC